MMRRTPMRRTGWARKSPTTVLRTRDSETNQPLSLVECAQAAIKKIVKSTAKMAKIEGMGTALPKRKYIRSPALLAAVRKLPCQHTGEVGSTEPAHSNWGAHGKGGRIKADDNRVAALSHSVHRELDQGKNWTEAERKAIWWRAHVKTIRLLLARGEWPMDVPVPDIREFDA